MAERSKQNGQYSSGSLPVGLLLGLLLTGSANAAVVRNTTVVDFTSVPVSFGYGTSDFTLSNTGEDFFGSPVAVSTAGGGLVRTIFGSPSVDFDPPRNATPYDGTLSYGSFASPAPIAYSGPASFLGLLDTTSDGTHYGYAEFYQNTLVGYAFESVPGVSIQAASLVSAVPLPASAPLFGAALVAFGVIGLGIRRGFSAQT